MDDLRSPVPQAPPKASSPCLALLSGSRGAVLSPRGEVGFDETRALVSCALSLAEGRRSRLVLDLRRVTHFDHRCLPTLWTVAQRLRARGGDLRLAGPSRYLRSLLCFTGLETVLAVHPSPGSALRSYDVPRRRRSRT